MKIFKNILWIFALFLVVLTPAYAKDESIGTVQQQINSEQMPNGISFIAQTELKLSDGRVSIPKDSTVYAYITNNQGERRWHRGGFIICKLKGYILPGATEKDFVDIEENEIYMVARRYAPIDKKEAAKNVAEFGISTAAGFIVPGIDIAYYFTRGMIHKEEGKTRFKSGISSAYENSIFWFWLKGKPMDLEENASISFTEIDKNKLEKLNNQIEKRKVRSEKIQEKKESVKEFMSY